MKPNNDDGADTIVEFADAPVYITMRLATGTQSYICPTPRDAVAIIVGLCRTHGPRGRGVPLRSISVCEVSEMHGPYWWSSLVGKNGNRDGNTAGRLTPIIPRWVVRRGHRGLIFRRNGTSFQRALIGVVRRYLAIWAGDPREMSLSSVKSDSHAEMP